MENKLYYGDNLEILRKYIPDNSVDLIYLDPPFNSKANYNMIFKEKNGTKSVAQIKAFSDFWHWDEEAQKTYEELVNNAGYPEKLKKLIIAYDTFLGHNDLFAYLVMLAIRLVELHRVLKDTGSLYLHCDPTASHYIKLVLDAIFGPTLFLNEIIWKRQTAKKGSQFDKRSFGNQFDSILVYNKTKSYKFKIPKIQLDPETMSKKFNRVDKNGRRFRTDRITLPQEMARKNLIYEYKGFTPPYGWMVSKDKLIQMDKENKIFWTKDDKPYRKYFMDEYEGQEVSNVWVDIPIASGNERLGYPTQKPLALLERIITASSDEGDLVLDPFCGCGTALDAAEKLHRNWIGMDITHIAIHVIGKRLKERYQSTQFKIIGEPTDLEGARELAMQDRFQFQAWALSLINATPSDKMSGDHGIDGTIHHSLMGKNYFGIIQVKSGKVGPRDIRDLKGTINTQKADYGIFITLESPTKDMMTEVVSSGHLKDNIIGEMPKIQAITIEDLLKNRKPEFPAPPNNYNVAKRGKRNKKESVQKSIDDL